MHKTAFIFPGQGSQAVGMMSGFDVASEPVRRTFDEASEALGYNLWSLVQDGPEERLNQTETTQPALLTASIAVWRCWLAAGGHAPDFMAGHSLGEYSALVASGVLGFTDAVGLVAERGRQMQAATPVGAGSMAAILGLDDAVLEAICVDAAQGKVVSCANYNSPGQVVIAGHREAVERACELASAAGARRAIPLAVSVPSHCALMKPAAEALQPLLDSLPFAVGAVPVVHNVDVEVHSDPDAMRSALAGQLWRPVRWRASIERLAAEGVGRFVECGPGKVLTGLNRRIVREAEAIPLNSREAVAELVGQGS